MKKLLCLVLAAMMLLGSVAMAEGLTYATDGIGVFNPSYDFMETDCNSWPLVEDGEKVQITVMTSMDDAYSTDPETTHFWTWVQEETGVDFVIEQILNSALTQRKSLMFASAELPDIMLSIGISTTEMMNYGAGEELLLDLAPYITPELMPNLCLALDEFPIWKANATAPNGAVYSFPWNRGYFSPYGESDRIFYDLNRMKAVGIEEPPTTLDGFIDMLYAMKEADPDCIPLGGANESMNPGYLIMNAMGFVGPSGHQGFGLTVRNGEAVFPVGDPLFKEYLAIMKKFYADGIIAESFFTDKSTEVNAKMSEGKLGVYPFVPFTVTPAEEDFSHWVSFTPMTSEWNDKRQWREYNCWETGGFVVSAETEYPELIARFADFFYSDYGFVSIWDGPRSNNNTAGIVKGAETYFEYDNLDTNGMPNMKTVVPEIEDGTYEGDYDYKYSIQSGPFSTVGLNGGHVATARALGLPEGVYATRHTAYMLRGIGFRTEEDFNYYMENIDYYAVDQAKFDIHSPEGQFRGSMYQYVTPYEASFFPKVTYFTVEQSEALTEYQSTIKTYGEGEIAKFITGQRDLEDFDAFVKELEDMGLRDWEKIYADYYVNYLANG